MTSNLKELLTQEIAGDGSPLFITAAALSKAIVAQSNGVYTSARSVNTLLGFIFRSERPCPSTLREVILRATHIRLSKHPQKSQENWAEQINKAVDFLNTETARANLKRRGDPFELLLERAEAAKKHFIIKPLTAEQEKGIQRAEQLTHMLLSKLGICPRSEAPPNTEYWFLLPSRPIGEQFWEKLREKAYMAAKTSKNNSWIEQRIRFLDKNNFLQVYIVPSYVCGSPLVVYDPDHTRDAGGFSLSYHHDSEIEAFPWDGVSIYHWKANVFEHFKWQDPKTQKPFSSEGAALDFMKKTPHDFAGYRCHFPF